MTSSILSGRSLKVWALSLAWLAVLIGVLYGRSATYDFVHTDDVTLLIDRQEYLANFYNAPRAFSETFFPDNRDGGYYRPLATLSFFADVKTSGFSPGSFRRTNLLLHFGCASLLLALLRKIGAGFPAALGVTSIFAVHPALVSAVAWIPGRNDLLVALFALGAALLLIEFSKTRRAWLLPLHALVLLAALLSKETALILVVPFGIALLLRSKPWRKAIAGPAAMWAAAFAAYFWLRHNMGEVSVVHAIFGQAGNALGRSATLVQYLGKSVFPIQLSVLADSTDTSWMIGFGALAVVGYVAYSLFRRAAQALAPRGTPGSARCGASWVGAWPVHSALGDGPAGATNVFVFGWLVWLLAIAPALTASDHLLLENRLYLPMIGVAIAAAGAISCLGIDSSRGLRWLGVAGILCACRSFIYLPNFQNWESFTDAAVGCSPNLALSHLIAGTRFSHERKLELAEKEFLETIRLDPNVQPVHNNLGLVYLNTRRVKQAEAEFERELELHPGYDKAAYNLGLALAQMGRTREAAIQYQRALELNSGNIDAIGELMAYYASIGDMSRSATYRKMLEQKGFKFLDGAN